MNLPLTSIHKTKVGCCPHGLPAGACPICSGMGGGGGGSSSKKAAPAGEMSWDECVAVGNMLKAQRLAQHQRDVAMQAQLHTPMNAQSRLENMAQKIADFSQKLTDFIKKTQDASQTRPTFIDKTIAFAAKIALPILNVLQNIPLMAQKGINLIKEKLADISDKLNAFFGELKNSVEKKISDKLKDFKKKFKSLFGIFDEIEETELSEKETEKEKLENSLLTSPFSPLTKTKSETLKQRMIHNGDSQPN